jgi:hypothetical protein
MTNPLYYIPTLLLLGTAAALGALMLWSPTQFRRLSYWLAYGLVRQSSEVGHRTENPSSGPQFVYRLRGLLMFLTCSYLAGEILYAVGTRTHEIPPAIQVLPQTSSANGPWPQIFMGLIFVLLALWLMLKPEITNRWALDRLGKLRKEPTKTEIRTGAATLALGFLAFGLYTLWVALKCFIVDCR